MLRSHLRVILFYCFVTGPKDVTKQNKSNPQGDFERPG